MLSSGIQLEHARVSFITSYRALEPNIAVYDNTNLHWRYIRRRFKVSHGLASQLESGAQLYHARVYVNTGYRVKYDGFSAEH